MIRPDYFARLTFDGVAFEAVLRHYVDWVLGVGEFDRLRPRRLAIGILPAWASAELCRGANLNGKSGCRAVVLHRLSSVCIALVHADETNPRVSWHSVATLTRAADALVIEHAVGRTAPEGMVLEAVATSPAVLIALLDRDKVSVTPPEFRLSAPVTLGVASIPAFARNLLSTHRSVPITLLAPQRSAPAIDVVRLARALRSIAMVACLDDGAALDAFNGEIDDRNNPELECAEEAVRLYFPLSEADPNASHPTWPRERIVKFSPHRRTSELAAQIISDVTARTLPADFFSVV